MSLVPFGKFRNSLKFDARESGTGVQLGPVYGNSTWLAIRGNNNVITSTDGITWSVPSSSTGAVLTPTSQYDGTGKSLKYINGQFVFLVQGPNSAVYPTYWIQTSTDGITWTKRYNLFTPTNGTPQGSMTLDGGEWTQSNTNNNPIIEDIEYANGKYWMVGSKLGSNNTTAEATVYSSTDLVTWVTAYTYTNPRGFQRSYFNTIQLQSNELIVSGYFNISGQTGEYPLIVRSTNNGTSWTAPTQTVGTVSNGQPLRRLNAQANNGSTWIAVGNAGVVYGNSGGTSWNYLTSPNSAYNLLSIQYYNSTWVVFGQKYNATIGVYENAIFISGDGSSWTSKTVPSTNGLSNATLSKQTNMTVASGRLVGYNWTTTNASTFEFVNYRIPNQQPYIDYTADAKWKNWKTIDFWVYIESNSPSFSQYPILSQWDGENKQWSIYLESQGSGRTPYISVSSYNGTTQYIGLSQQDAYADGTASTAQWNHIRVVADAGTAAIYLNGARSGSTFSVPTQWPSSGSLNVGRLGNGYESASARDRAYWLDEVMINSTALNSTSATSITVPTERWVNDPTVMLLLHFDNNYLDDNVDPITTGSPLAAVFSLTATGKNIKTGQIPLEASTSLSATLTRTKRFTANLQAFASDVTVGIKKTSARATLTAQATQSAQSKRFRGITKTLQVTATMAITAKKLNAGRAQLTSQAQVTASPYDFTKAQAQLTSQVTVQAQALKILGTTANLQAFATELAVVVKAGRTPVDMRSAFTIQVTAKKFTGQAIALDSTASLNASITKYRPVEAALQTTATLTADIRKFKDFSASLTSTTTMTAVVVKTARITKQLESTVTLDYTVTRVLQGSADLEAFATELFFGGRTRPFVADLNATSTLVINTSVNKPTTASLQAFATTLAVGTKLSFDPYYTLTVPSETRNLVIHEETRILAVKPETRVNKIKGNALL